jgi:hypothetical protein
MTLRRRSLVLLAAAMLLAAVPARAQSPDPGSGPAANLVGYGDISFLLPADVASSVNTTRLVGDDPDVGPFAPEPPSTRFSLYGQVRRPAPGGQRGTLAVYRAADLGAYPATLAAAEDLVALLDARPDLTSDADGAPDQIPMLTDEGAAQAIRFLPTYLDTDTLSGVVFVTAFAQDTVPFSRDSFVAVFQGVSTDGSTFVAASIPLTIDAFPVEPTAEQIERVLSGGWQSYLRRSLRRLGETPAEGFTPSIASIGTLFGSITIGEPEAGPDASSQPAPPAG